MLEFSRATEPIGYMCIHCVLQCIPWPHGIYSTYARLIQYLIVKQCNTSCQQAKEEKYDHMIISIDTGKPLTNFNIHS